MNDVTTLSRATFVALELRVANTSERIIEGIVVPWDETSYMTPFPQGERFLRGSMTRTITERGARLKLFRNHNHNAAVGRAVAWDPHHRVGLFGRFRIAEVPAGDDVLHEVREGMLDAFSVGFRPVKARRGADGVREIVDAELHETSLAPIGAYDGAKVLAVRRASIPVLPPCPEVNLTPVPPVWLYRR